MIIEMSSETLKNVKFTCDKCGTSVIVRDVSGYTNPKGWGYEHPENPHSMFGISKDVCDQCLKGKPNGLGRSIYQSIAKCWRGLF